MKKSVYIPATIVNEALAKEKTASKKLLEPLKAFSIAQGAPIHILENTDQENPPEVHVLEADLWICIEGSPVFTVGGEIVNPSPQQLPDGTLNTNELNGSAIVGGEVHTLKAGDILYIPAGVPHSHKATGTARMYIIKIKEV